MSTTDAQMLISLEALAPDSPLPRQRRQGRLTIWLAGGWLALVLFCAVFADFLPFVRGYAQRFPGKNLKAPSSKFWFGTNKVSQDIFARTVYGARLSLWIAFASILAGLAVATVLGLTAGYYRGKIDTLISYGVDILLAFPPLVLTLFVTTFYGRKATWVILSLTILSIPPLTRVVRASTLAYSQREFVLAAKAVGAKDRRIIVREILPNVVPSMVSFVLTGMAVLIIAEGALSVLGQSVLPPLPTWGSLIADGRIPLEQGNAWWVALMPSGVMFLTILSFNLIGDVLSRRFDIKESLA